jgi:hypothetical protein
MSSMTAADDSSIHAPTTVNTRSAQEEEVVIPTSAFISVENTGDRVEIFPPIGVGEQQVNMKLITPTGREIPAFYHSPSLSTNHGADGKRSTITFLIDWPGIERLENVDEFHHNDAAGTLVINKQSFERLGRAQEFG